MEKQPQTFFLEEWLKRNSDGSRNTSSKASSPPSARAIIQAWADLRDSLQHQSFSVHHFQALKFLLDSGMSLYVAEPQVKLLLSILSAPNLSLPLDSHPLFLRLLYIWIRKSSKPSPALLDSAVGVVSQLFAAQIFTNECSPLFSEGILLLGALSFVPVLSENSRRTCLDLLCRLLEAENRSLLLHDDHIPNILAGIGYGLLSSRTIHFSRILDSLFQMLNNDRWHLGRVLHGLMILYLMEWVIYGCINSSEKISIFSREVLEAPKSMYSSFAIVMAAAGVLRASNRSVSSDLMQLRAFAEQRIEIVATSLVSETRGFTDRNNEHSVLLQCISLALARSGGSVFSKDSLPLCLAAALLTEVFPLQHFYSRILMVHPNAAMLGHHEVKEHLDSVIFKEAGAITSVFCGQYASANEGIKTIMENLIWDFCQDLYVQHRQVTFLLRGIEEELIGYLEKIAESAFLMVVVFALAVTKQRLDSRFPREVQLEISVKILISFSYVEYFRRMRLSEYMDTIKGVAVSVQEDETACVSFVESIPSYDDLTKLRGSSGLQKLEYIWSEDEVQGARILFYLRVIPTCTERLPASVFRKLVAPVVFLYMGHPNGKVTRASHSTFMAFISSGKDPDDMERVSLKEQLVFYYMQRSLEGYPGITPFEGMASGVAALVRYLPAGSPSLFYCINCLVEKASRLCSEVRAREIDAWDDELEPTKRILDLLLRLLSLVDIQVLPSLMQLLAKVIIQLPYQGQDMVLNDLHAQIAESDDVTRKPTLVSWLQSLSYLCSQTGMGRAPRKEELKVKASFWNKGVLGLNRMFARL